MIPPPIVNAGMIKETLLLTAKILGGFYFMKNKNSLAPQRYEIPIRAIYVDFFENLIHRLLVLALSVVKLFVALVRFISYL